MTNTTSSKFELRRTVATPGVLQALEESGQTPAFFLDRHTRGDWGNVSQEDWQWDRWTSSTHPGSTSTGSPISGQHELHVSLNLDYAVLSRWFGPDDAKGRGAFPRATLSKEGNSKPTPALARPGRAEALRPLRRYRGNGYQSGESTPGTAAASGHAWRHKLCRRCAFLRGA
jgi:hypothetical protein